MARDTRKRRTKNTPRRQGAATARTDTPIIPRSFTAETESRRLFETAVAPWSVTRWEQNDFGIYAVVEIACLIPGTADQKPTGKWFGVQLKSTDADEEPQGLRGTTGHLRYWLNHSLPVLLVAAPVVDVEVVLPDLEA